LSLDASAGYRVWRRLYAASGHDHLPGSRVRRSPSWRFRTPLFFGQPTFKSLSASDYGKARRPNTAINFQAVWTMKPLTNKLDLWISESWSFRIHVNQEVERRPRRVNSSRQSTASPRQRARPRTLGVDMSYRLERAIQPRAGSLRIGRQVEFLPSGDGLDLTVGGVQMAAASVPLRVRGHERFERLRGSRGFERVRRVREVRTGSVAPTLNPRTVGNHSNHLNHSKFETPRPPRTPRTP